jgi:hypothetical protein
VSGDLVAAFLGEPGVAGQVDEADGGRPRHPLLEPRGLERLLDVVDGVLGPDVLAMAPVDLEDGPLQQPDGPVPEPAAALDQLALVEAGRPEAALDVGLVELRLGLGDPAQAVGVHGQEAQGRVVVRPGAPEQLGDVEHGDVVLARAGAGLRRREAERLVQGPQERQRHIPVVRELPVGTVQPFRPGHHRPVEEAKRQRPPLDQLSDRLDREPSPRPGVQQAGPPDLPWAELRLVGGQGAERDQPAHEALGDAGSLGDLPDPLRHPPQLLSSVVTAGHDPQFGGNARLTSVSAGQPRYGGGGASVSRTACR